MFTQAETKIWRSLRRRKGRAATGLFLAEGLRVVAELVAEKSVKAVILCAKSARNQTVVMDLLERAMNQDHRVEVVRDALIDSIADAVTPQPVLAIAEVPERSWDNIESGLILVLDSVQDPGNVGTLIRTAAALGVAGVIGVGTVADPWAPKAVRASAGTVLKVPVLRTDTADTLAELKRRVVPLWVAGAGGEHAEDHLFGDAASHAHHERVLDVVLPVEVALFLGKLHGESQSPATRNNCHFV